MLILKIDVISPQAPERAFGRPLDMVRAADDSPNLALWRDVETEFGGDNHSVANRRQRLAYHLLASAAPGRRGAGRSPLVGRGLPTLATRPRRYCRLVSPSPTVTPARSARD